MPRSARCWCHGLEEARAVAVAGTDVHLLVASEDVVLGTGAIAQGVLEAVLVGVVGVLHGFLGPGLADLHRCLPMEGLESKLSGRVGIVGGSPLTHVDRRCAASAERRFLQIEHLSALVEGGDAGPQARSAVADHQNVGLVVPGLGHPLGGAASLRERSVVVGAPGQGGGAGSAGGSQGGALQKRAARYFLHVFLLNKACYVIRRSADDAEMGMASLGPRRGSGLTGAGGMADQLNAPGLTRGRCCTRRRPCGGSPCMPSLPCPRWCRRNACCDSCRSRWSYDLRSRAGRGGSLPCRWRR